MRNLFWPLAVVCFARKMCRLIEAWMSVMTASHAIATMIRIFRSDIEMNPYAIIDDPAMLKQLVGINIDCNGYVFGERKFVECFAHEPAQTHNGFAAEQ